MIYAKVKGQKLILSGDTAVADSTNYLKICFETDEEWSGYDVTAVFSDSKQKSYSVIMIDENPLYLGNGCCYVPHEVISAPYFTVSVFGTKQDSVITTPAVTVCVKESGYIEGEVAQPPTPNEYQQIISAVDEIKGVANSVRADADSGVFNGEQGERGPSGVYVGSGEMPQDCNVQIDPSGDTLDASQIATRAYVDERISNFDPEDVDVDLSDYPTKDEMQDAISAISADYIVERGVAGMWTWEKWNSGKAVCWGNQSLTVTINEAWGNIVGSPSFNVAFPFEFMEIPIVTAQILYTSNNCFLGATPGNASNSVSGNYTLCRATPYEGVQCTVSWYVIGNWK
jgi:hypothetical protein